MFMSPRSLFNIILKVMGIYFVKEVLLLLPSLISGFGFLNQGWRTEAWFIIFSVIITLAIYSLVIFYFVLDTDAVIDKLELTKGIEEENLSITVHRSTVLSIVIILVGIVMIITALPYFMQNLPNYFIERRFSYGTAPSPTRLVLYASELVLAILIIVYKRVLVNFIELKRRNTITPEPDSSTDQ
jgi:NADH:ubiquinone oxidoreductase subunit 5 (subunit L)/multisubunit Na+/H+ antiporter MnhA subunit